MQREKIVDLFVSKTRRCEYYEALNTHMQCMFNSSSKPKGAVVLKVQSGLEEIYNDVIQQRSLQLSWIKSTINTRLRQYMVYLCFSSHFLGVQDKLFKCIIYLFKIFIQHKRGPIMLFHFLNCSQCVVCMFRHKTIYKVTNLKVLSKGIYLVKKKNFSRTTANGSFGLQSCFPLFVTSQIVNPAYWSSTGWKVGRTLGWALHVSESKLVLVFLHHSISDENQLFSENVVRNFYLIFNLV